VRCGTSGRTRNTRNERRKRLRRQVRRDGKRRGRDARRGRGTSVRFGTSGRRFDGNASGGRRFDGNASGGRRRDAGNSRARDRWRRRRRTTSRNNYQREKWKKETVKEQAMSEGNKRNETSNEIEIGPSPLRNPCSESVLRSARALASSFPRCAMR
jgi:hypothetical protein